jgi:DUF4097 and DUF4098 domain-containing protein YvlB
MARQTAGIRAIVALGACAVLASACDVDVDAQGVTARDEKRFTVSGTPELTLATFDGAIEIRTWDRPEIEVVVERRADTKAEADSIEIKAEQSGNQISVEARRPTARERRVVFGFHVGRSASIVATVPRVTNLLARSGDGSITAERLDGRLELRTGDGAIRGNELKGQLRVHTGDGSIKLNGIDGALDIDTDDGSISVDGRVLGLTARSGDGSITVRAASGSAMKADWDVTTGDGRVQLELPGDFSAEIDAHTGDGRIDVDDLRIQVVGDAGRTSVRGRVGAGGRTLKVRSGDGSIVLRGGRTAERTEGDRSPR